MLREQAASNDRAPAHRRGNRCLPREGVADHQQSGALRRINHAFFLKAGFGIGADGAAIMGVGIGHHPRDSRSQQALDELSDEARAVATADHIRYANERIDAAGPGWMRAKTLIPGAQRITLDVAEPTVVKADNE